MYYYSKIDDTVYAEADLTEEIVHRNKGMFQLVGKNHGR